MEVISATPNPQLAIEILLGIRVFTQPPSKGLSYDKKTYYTLKAWNEWTGDIEATYTEERKVGLYLPVDTDVSLVNALNYKEYKVDYLGNDADTKWVTIGTGEMLDKIKTFDMAQWYESCERYAESVLVC
jgi:hypothetical protein